MIDKPKAIDRGVNYFVLKLESMGIKTEWSCEGHPNGFYLVFNAPYAVAGLLHSFGFFAVEIEGPDRWSLRIHHPFGSEEDKCQCLRWATESWEKSLKEDLCQEILNLSRLIATSSPSKS